MGKFPENNGKAEHCVGGGTPSDMHRHKGAAGAQRAAAAGSRAPEFPSSAGRKRWLPVPSRRPALRPINTQNTQKDKEFQVAAKYRRLRQVFGHPCYRSAPGQSDATICARQREGHDAAPNGPSLLQRGRRPTNGQHWLERAATTASTR